MNSEEYARTKAKFSSANDGENGGAEDISHHILSDIYELESKGLHRECAIYISEQLHLSLHYNTLVSRVVFRDLDFKVLSTWSMIALLRYTLWSRDSLARWYDLLDYTVRHYDDNNLNKMDLFGLVQIHKERKMGKYLSEALEETVKEIQGYSEEELKSKLERHKESNLAKTIDGILAFQLIDENDAELFTMPTGLGVEGMRKFIKECAKK